MKGTSPVYPAEHQGMTAVPSSPQNNYQRFKTTLTKLSDFNTLSAEAQESILAMANLRHYEPGNVIFLEGDPAEYVYILDRGWVKASRINYEGREQGLRFLQPVEIFGDVAVFNQTPYPCTTTALEPVDVWAIPAQKILELAKSCSELSMVFIRKLSERIIYYIEIIEDLSLRNVKARLAGTLLKNTVLKEGQLLVPRHGWTTFDEMAVRLGTVRDVLSRAIKSLEADGLIRVEKHAILILDPKGMSECADNHTASDT